MLESVLEALQRKIEEAVSGTQRMPDRAGCLGILQIPPGVTFLDLLPGVMATNSAMCIALPAILRSCIIEELEEEVEVGRLIVDPYTLDAGFRNAHTEDSSGSVVSLTVYGDVRFGITRAGAGRAGSLHLLYTVLYSRTPGISVHIDTLGMEMDGVHTFVHAAPPAETRLALRDLPEEESEESFDDIDVPTVMVAGGRQRPFIFPRRPRSRGCSIL